MQHPWVVGTEFQFEKMEKFRQWTTVMADQQ